MKGVFGGIRRLLGPSPRRLAAASGAPLVDLANGPSRVDAHELYHRARALGPVVVNAARPEWAIVGYDATVWALKNPQFFSNNCTADFDPLVVGNDPPGQAAWRRILAQAMATCDATTVESFTVQWLDAFVERSRKSGGQFDAVADLGCPLPESFTGTMLGLHDEETRRLVTLRPRNRTRLDEGWQAITAAIRGIVAERQPKERAGVLGALAAVADPRPLTTDEIVALVRLIWFAGTSTSTHFLPSLLLLMVRNPAVQEEMRAHPPLGPAFVNEALRMEGPTGVLPRRTVSAVELAGVRIPAGAMVKLCLIAANRDPTVFPDPDAIRPGRPGTSIAFGHGVHFCLGAMIAKTMAVTVATFFASRFPGMRPMRSLQDVRYESSEEFRSLRSLPLTLW